MSILKLNIKFIICLLMLFGFTSCGENGQYVIPMNRGGMVQYFVQAMPEVAYEPHHHHKYQDGEVVQPVGRKFTIAVGITPQWRTIVENVTKVVAILDACLAIYIYSQTTN